jgi:hypothetical protein
MTESDLDKLEQRIAVLEQAIKANETYRLDFHLKRVKALEDRQRAINEALYAIIEEKLSGERVWPSAEKLAAALREALK